jgi:hypothetical protein
LARLAIDKDIYKQTLISSGLSVNEAALATEANFSEQESAIALRVEYDKLRDSLKDKSKDSDKSSDALKKEIDALNLAADATANYKHEYDKLLKLQDAGLSEQAFAKEVAKLNEELANSSPVLNGFIDAFSDFLSTGANDFKSFANDIIGMFKNMLIKMITMAARNKIMLSMGMGGSALASSAAAGNVAGVGSAAGTGAMGTFVGGFGAAGGAAGTGLLGGMGSVASGVMSGGLAGGAGAIGTAVSGATAGLAGFGAAVGAVALPLLAVAAAISFFKKKTKELDSGINVTVKNMDTYVESWKKIETKRFWGLSKKVRTQMEAASAEISNPITEAILGVQTSVFNMADYIGIATGALDKFTYDFKLSLKGLTEDQQMTKITEELTKLGDSFSALLPNVSSMAELTAIYQERLGLELRLLQVQGDTEALRQIELSSINDYNKALLQQIFATEDATAASEAAAKVAQEIATEAARVAEEIANEYARIADERYGLETQLLQVLNDTEALRSRELDALDESNRALQEQIWAHEDAAEAIKKLEDALNSLQENDFATMLDFQRAQAKIRMGLPVANDLNMPAAPAISASTSIANINGNTVAELRSMREDIKEMHKESMFAYSKLIKNGKDSRDTLRSWDVVGLPAERTA